VQDFIHEASSAAGATTSPNLEAEDVREAIRYAAEAVRERELPLSGETASDGWLRGADKIAAYIYAPRSRVYGLVSAAHTGPPRRLGANRAALRAGRLAAQRRRPSPLKLAGC
jgi:hypothetical protein